MAGTSALGFDAGAGFERNASGLDLGAGLVDLERNLPDGVSAGASLRDAPRRLGSGLGIGLGTVYRLMDEVHVEAISNRGTRVIAHKHVVREDAPASSRGSR